MSNKVSVVNLKEGNNEITCITIPFRSFLEISLFSSNPEYFVKCKYYQDGFLVLNKCSTPLLTLLPFLTLEQKNQILQDIVNAVYFLHSHNIACLSIDVDNISIDVEDKTYRAKFNNVSCCKLVKSEKDKDLLQKDIYSLCFLYKTIFKINKYADTIRELDTKTKTKFTLDIFTTPRKSFTPIGTNIHVTEGTGVSREYIKVLVSVLIDNYGSLPVGVLFNSVDMVNRCRDILPEAEVDNKYIAFILYCNFEMFGIEYKEDEFITHLGVNEDELLTVESMVINACSRILYREYYHNTVLDKKKLYEFYEEIILSKEDIYFSVDIVNIIKSRLKEYHKVNTFTIEDIFYE